MKQPISEKDFVLCVPRHEILATRLSFPTPRKAEKGIQVKEKEASSRKAIFTLFFWVVIGKSLSKIHRRDGGELVREERN